MKKLLHICTGCGKEKMLAPNKKHYCDCNPGAKFVFMVKSDRKLAQGIISETFKQQGGKNENK